MSDQLLSNQIFSIVGTTATGKTSLALQIADEIIRQDKAVGVTIISADSRQVYKGLEVCSGSDVPPMWSIMTQFATACHGHPEFPIFLFGTSVLEPTAEWSVTHFRQYALPIIQQSFENGFSVIIVGGTGLYHEHLFSTDPLLDIPPNKELRLAAALLSLDQLQEKVATDASDAWSAMNDSDRYNPRRLIRALEKAAGSDAPLASIHFPFNLSHLNHATLGIIDSPENLKNKIRNRVNERLQHGALDVTTSLIRKYEDQLWKLAAFTSTGCKEIRMYLERQIDIDQLKELWSRRELQYAKRQLTWWKTHQFASSSPLFANKTKQWVDLSKNEQENWQTAVTQSCILALC